jgi:hypothetical protein
MRQSWSDNIPGKTFENVVKSEPPEGARVRCCRKREKREQNRSAICGFCGTSRSQAEWRVKQKKRKEMVPQDHQLSGQFAWP